jgi:hypothetical protein
MKHYKSYLIGFSTFVIISCSQYKKSSCQVFKTGHFSIHSEITGTNFMIDRKDTLQIQTEKETGKVSEWKIRWVNDCEYDISLLRDNYGLVKSYEFKELPTFNYKIIKTTSTYYIFQATYTPTQLFLSDTIWKVH